jgi:hypothetical protein
MKNLNKNALIPLILEGKKDEVISSIKNGNFDPSEISGGGRNLLYVALLKDEYDIADVLTQYAQKNNFVFNLINQRNDDSIVDDFFYQDKSLNKLFNFIKKDNLEIKKFDFLWHCVVFNANKADEEEALSNFKQNCILLKDHITKLDPIKTIIQLGDIGNGDLIELYYNICEFDKLPINKHPSFKLLTDVLVNSPKYFDYNIYTANQKNSNTPKKEISNLKKVLNNINNEKSFNKYFKGKEHISASLSKIYLHNHHYNYDPKSIQQMYNLDANNEYNNVFSILSKFHHENVGEINLPSLFTKFYLEEWPIAYFSGKSYARRNTFNEKTTNINEENNIKINELIHKYNLLGFSFAKDLKAEDVLSVFEKFTSRIKKLFPIEGEHIGNNQVWFNFSSTGQIKRNENSSRKGFYSEASSPETIINAEIHPDRIDDTVDTLVHEYTHFMQFNNNEAKEISLKSLDALKKEAYKWIDFPKEDFSNYFFNEAFGQYPIFSDLIEKNKSFLTKSFIDALDEPLNNFKDRFLNKIRPVFSSDDADDAQWLEKKANEILTETLFVINIYKTSQDKKDWSFEGYLWNYQDHNTRKEYWATPIEIHARLNSDLNIVQSGISKPINVSPKKLDAMKEILEYFNNTYVDKLVSSNKKRKLKI